MAPQPEGEELGMVRLTESTVRALRPRDHRFEAWDDAAPGFGVRVSPKGRKSFVYVYRVEGRSRRMTIGVYPRLSVEEARALYGRAREQVEVKGIDPSAPQEPAVIEKIESIIRSQKFEGAAADLLNANIIARDLGLKDSSETTHNGSIGFTDMTNEQLDARLEALINASAES